MTPKAIDLILTIKYSNDNNSGIETITPTIIDAHTNKIFEKILIQNVKDNRLEKLKEYINNSVRNIIFVYYKQNEQ